MYHAGSMMKAHLPLLLSFGGFHIIKFYHLPRILFPLCGLFKYGSLFKNFHTLSELLIMAPLRNRSTGPVTRTSKKN